ncbi:MAG: hypothetical protein ACOVQ7_01080 [Limnoraphis robusta]
MPRTARTARTARTEKSPRSERDSEVDVDVNTNEEESPEVDFGVNWKGLSLAISSKGVLKIGIGVAAVELNLKEPNNSKVSYVFELFEIKGERNGCTVVLTYYIKGIEAKKETRTIPECEEEEPPDPPEPPKPPGSPKSPFGTKPPKPKVDFPDCIPDNARVTYYVASSSEVVSEWNSASYLRIGGVWWTNPGVRQESEISNIIGFNYENRQWSIVTIEKKILTPFSYGAYLPDLEWVASKNFTKESSVSFKTKAKSGIWADVKREVEALASVTESGTSVTANHFMDTPECAPEYTAPPGEDWGEAFNKNCFAPYEYITYSYRVITPTIVVINPPIDPVCAEQKKAEKVPKQPPPIRGKNIMNEDCCKMTAALYEVFAVEEILSNGIKFPNRLIAAGAKDYSEVFNYLDFLSLVVREIDHLGIHPHEVTIKDVDPGTPGDQKISAEFVNATAWAQSLMENSLKNDGEADARLNLQIRLARLLLQTFVSSVAAKYKADAIADFLGVPTQEFAAKPSVPFDITLGQRQVKGFGTQQSDKDKIKKLSNKKVVELLDRFLRESNQDIVCERFDNREQSFLELLQQFIQKT